MKYIAYGSNMVEEQMAVRCPEARLVGTGYISGARLEFYLHATVEETGDQRNRVPVAVWEINQRDEQMLDRYEGYPDFYYKKELDLDITGIRTKKVRRRSVFVYIMHEDRPIGIPSMQYLRICAEGYDSFRFDIDYLLEAYEYCLEAAR